MNISATLVGAGWGNGTPAKLKGHNNIAVTFEEGTLVWIPSSTPGESAWLSFGISFYSCINSKSPFLFVCPEKQTDSGREMTRSSFWDSLKQLVRSTWRALLPGAPQLLPYYYYHHHHYYCHLTFNDRFSCTGGCRWSCNPATLAEDKWPGPIDTNYHLN